MNFEKLIAYIVEKYQCHTLILYGSYSRGDFDEESDVDLLGFTSLDIEIQDKSVFEGKVLDLWIYNDRKLKEVDQFLHVRRGKILLSENSKAQVFLTDVNELFNRGPKPQTLEAKLNTIHWLEKMQLRSLKGDLEGHYRLHWLLTDLLPIYFELVDQNYLGSKESFAWLKVNDSETYTLFEQAYTDPKADHVVSIIHRLKHLICIKV